MSQRYIIFFRAVVIAVVLATAPLFAANMILNQYAESQAERELEAMGDRYIQRADNAISSTVSALQRLDRDDIQTCDAEDRGLLQSVISSEGYIDAIGLVDRDGKRMCIVPDMELTGEAILPILQQDGPLVGIGMLDKSFLGARVAVVSWDLGNGYRLFAEVTPVAIAADPGPEYLRAYRRAELRLGNDILWFETGGYNSESSDPDNAIVVQVRSGRYPLEATLVAPKSAAIQVVHDLKIIAATACAAFALLFVAIGV
ncbi:MAG: EAL domain-containing protein, partial [Roseibium sp.]